jgi:hypothetical protein
MNDPEGLAKRPQRGQFIKAGSRNAAANGGRAYYFHNTAHDAGWGIHRVGRLYNFVSRNNLWPKPYLRPEDGPYDIKPDVERIPNFNDRYARPEAGAQQSGTPPMRFGAERNPL